VSSASRKRREAAERQERAEAAGLVCHVCNHTAKRAPWGGPWLCSACEEERGAPARPENLGDVQINVAGRQGERFTVQVYERRPRR
jgi:hypothetical protein